MEPDRSAHAREHPGQHSRRFDPWLRMPQIASNFGGSALVSPNRCAGEALRGRRAHGLKQPLHDPLRSGWRTHLTLCQPSGRLGGIKFMVCKFLLFSSVESRCADGTIGRAVRSSIGASGGIFSCEQPVGQEKRREERGAWGRGAEAGLHNT